MFKYKDQTRGKKTVCIHKLEAVLLRLCPTGIKKRNHSTNVHIVEYEDNGHLMFVSLQFLKTDTCFPLHVLMQDNYKKPKVNFL